MKFFLLYATKAAKPSACCAAGIHPYHTQPLLPKGGDNRPTTSRRDCDTTGKANHNYQLSTINYKLYE